MVDKSIQEIKSWHIKKLRILETYRNYVVDKHGCLCISETPFASIESPQPHCTWIKEFP